MKNEKVELGIFKLDDKEYYRAYELHNGVVFTVKDTMIEFYDGRFFEVKEEVFTFRNGIFPMKRYSRTGKEFTLEDLNNLV